jgi:hypothetical protein
VLFSASAVPIRATPSSRIPFAANFTVSKTVLLDKRVFASAVLENWSSQYCSGGRSASWLEKGGEGGAVSLPVAPASPSELTLRSRKIKDSFHRGTARCERTRVKHAQASAA